MTTAGATDSEPSPHNGAVRGQDHPVAPGESQAPPPHIPPTSTPLSPTPPPPPQAAPDSTPQAHHRKGSGSGSGNLSSPTPSSAPGPVPSPAAAAPVPARPSEAEPPDPTTTTISPPPPPLTPEDDDEEAAAAAHYARFSPGRKHIIVALLSFSSLLSPVSSTSVLAATPEVAAEYGTTGTAVNVVNAGYMLAMGVSPVVWGPVSQVWGRRMVGPLSFGSFLSVLSHFLFVFFFFTFFIPPVPFPSPFSHPFSPLLVHGTQTATDSVQVNQITAVLFFACSIGTALAPNLAAFVVFRILTAFEGTAFILVGSACIG